MKKLFSTNYSSWQFNIATLLLRVVFGATIIPGGYGKIQHFNEYKSQFINFMGLGQSVSLSLVIFAEFFCAILIVAGLFTRLAAIPLIIAMSVVVFHVFHADIFAKDAGYPTLFLTGFIAIFLVGPGKASIDGMIGK